MNQRLHTQHLISPACLHNIAETQAAEDGSLSFCRVPLSLLPSLNEKAVDRSTAPAGAEIRFRQSSPSLRVVLRRMTDRNAAFAPPAAVLAGAFYGDFQHNWYALGEGDTEILLAPPAFPAELVPHRRRFDPTLTRLILPVFPGIRLVAFEGDYQSPRAADLPLRTLLSYGSSITHGAYTPLATETYPAIVARAFAADLLNLGFGGGAKLEPEMADWLASRKDWHAATLEMGINVFGGLDPEGFRSRVRRFLAPLADTGRPIACLDMIPFREELNGTRAHKAGIYRQVVGEEVARLNRPAVRHIPYAPALGDPTSLSADLLHPSAGGFATLGQNLTQSLFAFAEFSAALNASSPVSR